MMGRESFPAVTDTVDMAGWSVVTATEEVKDGPQVPEFEVGCEDEAEEAQEVGEWCPQPVKYEGRHGRDESLPVPPQVLVISFGADESHPSQLPEVERRL